MTALASALNDLKRSILGGARAVGLEDADK